MPYIYIYIYIYIYVVSGFGTSLITVYSIAPRIPPGRSNGCVECCVLVLGGARGGPWGGLGGSLGGREGVLEGPGESRGAIDRKINCGSSIHQPLEACRCRNMTTFVSESKHIHSHARVTS